MIDVECDLWPLITYGGGESGYKGLKVTVVKDLLDTEKMEKVRWDSDAVVGRDTDDKMVAENVYMLCVAIMLMGGEKADDGC